MHVIPVAEPVDGWTLHKSYLKGNREAEYGQLLGKYLDDPGNLFVVSSDFCHWGSRFGYTFYDRSKV